MVGVVGLSKWHAFGVVSTGSSEYEIGIGGTVLALSGRFPPTGRLFANATSPGKLKLKTRSVTRCWSYCGLTPGAPVSLTVTYRM